MHGPTGIFWANLTPFSPQSVAEITAMLSTMSHRAIETPDGDNPATWLEKLQVGRTPSWPRSWANFSLF